MAANLEYFRELVHERLKRPHYTGPSAEDAEHAREVNFFNAMVGIVHTERGSKLVTVKKRVEKSALNGLIINEYNIQPGDDSYRANYCFMFYFREQMMVAVLEKDTFNVVLLDFESGNIVGEWHIADNLYYDRVICVEECLDESAFRIKCVHGRREHIIICSLDDLIPNEAGPMDIDLDD